MYMLKRAPTIAALGFGLLAGACGGHDGGATAPGAGVNGSYTLRRVNHVEVPAEAELEWGAAGFRRSLQLTGEGSWQMQIRYDNLDSGEALTLQDTGGYEMDGPTLHLSSDQWDEFDGALDGNSITIKYDFDGDGTYESDFTFTR